MSSVIDNYQTVDLIFVLELKYFFSLFYNITRTLKLFMFVNILKSNQ
jgi:hypothetical protein